MDFPNFYEGCRKGDFDLVKKLVDEDDYPLYLGVENACLGGHLKIVEFLCGIDSELPRDKFLLEKAARQELTFTPS